MREVKNTETGKVRLVPDATAEEIRKGKYLAKQGWEVVERTEPPFEVVQFQETKKVCQVKPESVKVTAPIEVVAEPVPEKVVEVASELFDSSKMTVRQIQRGINEFTPEQLQVLAGDSRKSVSDLAKKLLNG